MVDTPEVEPSSTLSRTTSQFPIGFPSPSPSTLSSPLSERKSKDLIGLILKIQFEYYTLIRLDSPPAKLAPSSGLKTVIAACTALRTKLSSANIQCGLMLCIRKTAFTCRTNEIIFDIKC